MTIEKALVPHSHSEDECRDSGFDKNPLCHICLGLALRASEKRCEVLAEAVKKYLSECRPHPCPDLALRARYRDELRAAIKALELSREVKP